MSGEVTKASDLEKISWQEQLFESVHIGIVVVNADRVMTMANQTFCTLLGYSSPTDVVGHSTQILHPSESSFLDFAQLDFRDVLHGEAVSLRCQLRKKDGTPVWVRLSGQPNKNNESILWTVVDIQQHMATEEQLRHEKEFNQNLIATAQVIILVLDTEARIVQINPFMEQLSGYKQDDVVGKDWFDTFLPKDDHSTVRNIFIRAVSDIDMRGQINFILTNGGEKRLIEWDNKTLKSADGEVEGVLCIGKDVTERVQIEQQRTQLLRAIDHSHDTIVITDEAGAIQYANPAFERITGYSCAEALGQNPRILKSGEHDGQFYDDMWATLTAGRTWFGRLFNKKKNGDFYTEEASISPVHDASGEITHYVAVKRDVTEEIRLQEQHRELESQLHQQNKMEAIGVMAGGMAHNFNNNLAVILGNLELAQNRYLDNRDFIPLLKNARIAALRARDLIQSLLTYSRAENLEKHAIQLPSLVTETLNLLNSTIPSTVLIESLISPDSCDAAVMANPSQIQEVLFNLCSNAVHAMNEKGGLTISLECTELDAEAIPASFDCSPGCYVKLSVQDTGTGIPSEILDKIFDPFFTTKKVGEGTGLGLTTVLGIMQRHRGMIHVDTIAHEGTTFALYFPCLDQAHRSAHFHDPIADKAAADGEIVGGSERILFVDDEDLLVTIGKEILVDEGYHVTALTDSVAALALFSESPNEFDLVITDQTMAELCGQELIGEIKKIRADIPTILCSGHSNIFDENTATDLDIDVFLKKPVLLPELLQVVRDTLDVSKCAEQADRENHVD